MESPDSASIEAEDETSVFVSYSRADQKRAMPVIGALEQAGFRVWWDGLLEGGDNFLPTTDAALEGADAVVVLWSKVSVDSHWVRDEATSGRDRHCLVPLSLDGVQPPLGFRQFQVIDLSKWNGKPDTPEMARLVRGLVLELKQRDFVTAARSIGVSEKRILWRHIAPNLARPCLVQYTIMLPAYLLAETALSFFGVGLQEPEPSWGRMLMAANDLSLLAEHPFILLTPAFALSLFVLGVRLLTDELAQTRTP